MTSTAGQRLRASRVNALTNREIFNGIGTCSLAGTTSASYVDVTSASKSFTKILGATDSDVIVRVNLSCYVSVIATVVKFGVRINSVDTDATSVAINVATSHTSVPSGAVRITSLAAGTYTVQLRALRVSGTGTITIDASDTVSMDIHERVI